MRSPKPCARGCDLRCLAGEAGQVTVLPLRLTALPVQLDHAVRDYVAALKADSRHAGAKRNLEIALQLRSTRQRSGSEGGRDRQEDPQKQRMRVRVRKQVPAPQPPSE